MFTWEEAGLLRQMILVVFWVVVALVVFGIGLFVLRFWF
jgi:hypothetical protein